MARRLQAWDSFARAAAVTAAAAVSVGAFPAGPPSAAASARPIGGDLQSMSCASAGNCAAVGELDFPHASRPLVVSEKNGIWGEARTVPGLSALPGGEQFAELAFVSCSSAGDCAAGGFYQQNGSTYTAPSQAFVVTERNGVWGTAKAVRGLARLNVGGSAGVDFMSCRSPGDCTASGTYEPTDCPGAECGRVFVVSEKNGTWGRAGPVPGLPAIDHEIAQDNALTCASPGNCAVAGSYGGFLGVDRSAGAFVATQRNGAWGRVHTFKAIAAVATFGASMDLLSCRAGGNCTGTGTYWTAGTDHVFAVRQTHGSWGAARLIPGISSLPGGKVSYPADDALSCPSAGNCTVGGTYVSTRDGAQPYVATETHGTWGRARALPGVGALSTGKRAGIAALVCFPGGNCTAAGGYGIRTGTRFVGAIYVTAEKNGTWGKPRRVPGSGALSTDIILETLSCGALGNCSVGGSYGGKRDDEPFVATEKNGTWGNAERVPGIQP